MKEFPTGLQARPRARQRPSYRRTTLLDLVRAERRVKVKQAELEKRMADLMLSGISISRIDPFDFYAVAE